jgi:hypothetical protein
MIRTDNFRNGPILVAALFVLIGAGAMSARADTVPPLADIPFVELDSPCGPGSSVPWLTTTNDRVWLTWIERPATGVPALRIASHDGRRWSAPNTVVADTSLFVNWADYPRLLALADGLLVLAYLERTSPEPYAYDVRVVLSRDGGATWTPAETPHADRNEVEHGFVSLAPDPVEGFWIFWLDGRNHAGAGHGGHGDATTSPDTELRGALWRNGKFEQETRLDARVCDCCQTTAARTLEGLAVAYRDRGAKEMRDVSVVRYERRVWSEPFVIRNDGWQIDGCPVNGPAMAARGRLLALSWFTDANDSSEVFVAMSDSSSFGLSRIVKVDAGRPLGRVDVEWLPDETALVAWFEQSGDTSADLCVRRLTLRGEMSPVKRLAATTVSRAAGFPQIAVRDIDIWVAWTDIREQPGRVKIGKLDLKASR